MKTKLALVLTLALTPAAFAEEMKGMEMKHSMPMDNNLPLLCVVRIMHEININSIFIKIAKMPW